MSTDFSMLCVQCGKSHHLGQRFTCGWSFGYGSQDAEGVKEAGDFIQEHAYHDLRVFETNNLPTKETL